MMQPSGPVTDDDAVHGGRNESSAKDPIDQLYRMCSVREWETPKFEFNVKCYVKIDHITVFWAEGKIWRRRIVLVRRRRVNACKTYDPIIVLQVSPEIAERQKA